MANLCLENVQFLNQNEFDLIMNESYNLELSSINESVDLKTLATKFLEKIKYIVAKIKEAFKRLFSKFKIDSKKYTEIVNRQKEQTKNNSTEENLPDVDTVECDLEVEHEKYLSPDFLDIFEKECSTVSDNAKKLIDKLYEIYKKGEGVLLSHYGFDRDRATIIHDLTKHAYCKTIEDYLDDAFGKKVIVKSVENNNSSGINQKDLVDKCYGTLVDFDKILVMVKDLNDFEHDFDSKFIKNPVNPDNVTFADSSRRILMDAYYIITFVCQLKQRFITVLNQYRNFLRNIISMSYYGTRYKYVKINT